MRCTRVLAASLLGLGLTGCLFGRTDPAVQAAACAPDARAYDGVLAEPALTGPLGGAEPDAGGVPPSFDEKTGRCGTTLAVVTWSADPGDAQALIEQLGARLRADGWTEVAAGFGGIELSKVVAGEAVTLIVGYDSTAGAVEARGRRTATR